MEPTLWDLKLIFGQTDQQALRVSQHSSITLSWPEIKVMIYFLRAHLAGHEAQVGRIVLVPDIVPPISEDVPQGVASASIESWKKSYQAMNAVFEEFIRENPEATPSVLAAKKR